VLDLDCRAERAAAHDFVLPVHAIFLLRRETSYRVRHPLDGGDRSTIVRLADAALTHADDRFARVRRPCSARVAMENARFFAQLERGAIDAFEAQERALLLASEMLGTASVERSVRPRWRTLATEAEVFLVAHFRELRGLQDVAEALGVSPSHLSRVFRAVVGTTLHRYLSNLRLRAALGPLARGARDISALAYALGFSDGAHFTNAFRTAFGMPPSKFRAAAA
jgi:AraC-like DNA-binding protein